MSHHKRSQEAKKRRNELYEQRQFSKKYIRDYEFKDKVCKEEVNLVPKVEVEYYLEIAFDGYLLAAVPDVDRGDVLDIPNIYHLELFQNCNEAGE